MFFRQTVKSETQKTVKTNFISSFIAENTLFKSTPDPSMFGNPANPRNPSQTKGWDQENWLTSRFHFSFAEYFSPDRSNFGPLRVLNDDRVSPQRMFGTHPHRDAEIVTIVIEGELTHADSMGNRETLQRGSAQYLSAGTGITHSEGNNSNDKMLRFCQLWFTPKARGVKPNYGSLSAATYDPELRHNKFFHVITDYDNKEQECKDVKVRLHCDINLYICELDVGATVQFPLRPDRAFYSVLCEGKNVEATVKSGGQQQQQETHQQTLNRHDGFTVSAFQPSVTDFKNAGTEKAFLLLIEMQNSEKRQ